MQIWAFYSSKLNKTNKKNYLVGKQNMNGWTRQGKARNNRST